MYSLSQQGQVLCRSRLSGSFTEHRPTSSQRPSRRHCARLSRIALLAKHRTGHLQSEDRRQRSPCCSPSWIVLGIVFKALVGSHRLAACRHGLHVTAYAIRTSSRPIRAFSDCLPWRTEGISIAQTPPVPLHVHWSLQHSMGSAWTALEDLLQWNS